MKHSNWRPQSAIGACLASIAVFSSASSAQQGFVETTVEAEVRSSRGVRVSSASIAIPLDCRYHKNEVQIVKQEPPGTFKPRAAGDSTSFNVTVVRDPNSKSERVVVLTVVAYKSGDGPDLYLKARLSVHMSCEGDKPDQELPNVGALLGRLPHKVIELEGAGPARAQKWSSQALSNSVESLTVRV